MKIAFVSYGHTRIAEHAHVMRNSVLLTNYGAYLGCKDVGEVIDYSPLVGHGGVNWAVLGTAAERLQPADLLYCQAAISLECINKWKAIAPGKPIVLQPTSSYPRKHLSLMQYAMDKHNIHWEHNYARNGNSQLNREEAEAKAANYIFVMSRWIKKTYDEYGLGDKTIQFASQLIDIDKWNLEEVQKPAIFTVFYAAQLGLRKGTFDLLAAWKKFWPKFPTSQLIVAGLPEHGAPLELRQKLEDTFNITPGLVRPGWIAMEVLAEAYKHSHVYIMPSIEEGSTMTGVEAALCGLPLIATENTGIDLLVHGETGWQVTPFDSDSIAEALCDAASNLSRLVQMGAAARVRAMKCGIDAFAGGVANNLRKILNH